MENAFQSDGKFVEVDSFEIVDALPCLNCFLHFGFRFIDFALLYVGIGQLSKGVSQSHSGFSSLNF